MTRFVYDPVAPVDKCQISELTSSEGSVRAPSGAGYLLLTGMVSALGSGRIDGQRWRQ